MHQVISGRVNALTGYLKISVTSILKRKIGQELYFW